MVQFNLLPDVKLEYVKKQRSKRLVMMGAFGITGLCIFVLVLLFMIVNVFQKQHISNLNEDIEKTTAELKAVPELDKVLTVQNQLNVVNGLHEDKPAAFRIYNYLIQMTPNEAKISEVSVDFVENKMTISGSATSLQVINKFVDTLKFTEYVYSQDGEPTEPTPAFSQVVLSSYGISDNDDAANRTSYTIDFSFDRTIFDNALDVQLVVPPIISTRSVTERPQELFEAKPEEPTEGGAQ